MKVIRNWLVIPLMFMAMVACTVQPKLETTTDYVGASYATIDALTQTVILYYQNGMITKEEAMGYAKKLDEAFSLTKTAEMMLDGTVDGDPMVILQKVNQVLFALQKELEAREGK